LGRVLGGSHAAIGGLRALELWNDSEHDLISHLDIPPTGTAPLDVIAARYRTARGLIAGAGWIEMPGGVEAEAGDGE
jgi:hypothetical protein